MNETSYFETPFRSYRGTVKRVGPTGWGNTSILLECDDGWLHAFYLSEGIQVEVGQEITVLLMGDTVTGVLK